MPKGATGSIIGIGAVIALGALIAFGPVLAPGAIHRFFPTGGKGTVPPSGMDHVAIDDARFGESVRPGPDSPAIDNTTRTAAIPEIELPEPTPAAPGQADATLLKSGLDALAAADIDTARDSRDRLPTDALDRHILDWAMALSGDPAVRSGEVATAMTELSQWPGEQTLRRNLERALYRERAEPQTVIDTLGKDEPQTVQGIRALARAYLAVGKPEQAHAVLSPFWRTELLEPTEELAIVKEFGAVLSTEDHRVRMERMFYAERPKAGLRMASLADAKELADAWAAVLRKDKQAKKLLDAVPESQRSAGYLFATAKYLRHKNNFAEAAATMMKAPRDKTALVDPDEWWVERRILSRDLVDGGDVKTAYQLVAAHSAETASNVVEAEFHAGWYALRGLRDPKTAARHFAAIAAVANGPGSLSRAYYWLGRAAEAGGGGDANTYFKTAARYGTAFYGQLAAARIGSTTIPVVSPAASASDAFAFEQREAVRAIRRLENAGYPSRAEILYRDLADQLGSPGELALLAAMAEKRGNHYLALRVAKIAAGRGLDIGALTHPVGVIPASADISGAGMALAYAIARQESEFNVGAVSGAGARGLLQLLPGTAQEVARKTGLPYSKDRLTTDAGYNATLGAAFLGEQLSKFGGSYVLTFAGYNAGPRRAREWIAKYGDPRGKDLDTVVDWIERIPFTETRTYVQRVMENYEVYKMRISGTFDIADDLVNGR